jgi:hypothetical protein
MSKKSKRAGSLRRDRDLAGVEVEIRPATPVDIEAFIRGWSMAAVGAAGVGGQGACCTDCGRPLEKARRLSE